MLIGCWTVATGCSLACQPYQVVIVVAMQDALMTASRPMSMHCVMTFAERWLARLFWNIKFMWCQVAAAQVTKQLRCRWLQCQKKVHKAQGRSGLTTALEEALQYITVNSMGTQQLFYHWALRKHTTDTQVSLAAHPPFAQIA
jgi:hypothetical protein